MNASGGVPTKTSSGVGANDDGGNVSHTASTSRWKCIVPFGRPVVPDVNAIMQTSSDAVATFANVAGCRAAQRRQAVGRVVVREHDRAQRRARGARASQLVAQAARRRSHA